MGDEIHYKEWRIAILPQGSGWKALIYRPGSPLHETVVPHDQNRHAVIEEAKSIVDRLFTT